MQKVIYMIKLSENNKYFNEVEHPDTKRNGIVIAIMMQNNEKKYGVLFKDEIDIEYFQENELIFKGVKNE